jgi:cytidylate kinase
MTLVALSASYGAGGTRIGPALAERLGVPFLDRAIPVAVAEQLDVSVDDAAAHDEESRGASFLERILSGFIGTDVGAPTAVPAETFTAEDFRRATEEILRRQAESGEGVILGRGGVVVLRDDPRVLRVRLDGPAEERIRHAIALGDVDEQTARAALQRLDRTHADYARQFYGVDIRDPSLYHLVIDSTAVEHDTCVELIAAAAASLARNPR